MFVYLGTLKPACDECQEYPDDVRRAGGCIDNAPDEIWCDRRGKSHFQCPRREAGEDVNRLLRCYHALKEYGVLPAPGAYTDQAASFLDAIGYIDSVVAKHAAKEARRNARS